MMRTKLLSLVPRATVACRHMSSATKLTTVEVNDKTGIATLTMNRPPVNGLNLELLRDLQQSIEEIEGNKSCGLILTSSNPTIFSAGLDILEMYKPDKERIRAFWTQLQDVWLALYGSSVPTAAAINGHSPAGGCLLAASCEYRVMLPKFTIGLNETQLGIVAPQWFMSTYLSILPRREAERSLNQGRMFTTEEALRVGLVDEIASSKEEALAKCADFIATFAKVNPLARSLTKQQFRSADLQQLENERVQDLEKFLFFINQPAVQKGLGIYLESLKKKSKN
ncbi:enoyl-CoA delta isomerase 1, mitochondrial [Drosophila grimshawi]|uniref:Enoyl-CoA delta isomerase 1, mitochondrial n=1 Tax=Drosophila grimshawi TaxID=7222 RepID=B4JE40_DROGR|nr:enoyl-CoA delta isomerase 1, mitochondrial [Drosophila grimshawi]XP_032592463.1 enoyl-CoA delta isomerase 1, mitochondrial [Drosophila grimshawi]EDW03560.1 GH11302 [Drosophila grimshawi]